MTFFSLFQLGMCTGMILNLVKTLSEDREEIAASREKSLAASSAVLNRSIPFDPELPSVVPPRAGKLGRLK
jgi:hypothetical protein